MFFKGSSAKHRAELGSIIFIITMVEKIFTLSQLCLLTKYLLLAWGKKPKPDPKLCYNLIAAWLLIRSVLEEGWGEERNVVYRCSI